MLRRAGYPPDPGGGVLSAAGIGAILSPPTLGAAAFIIAEFLEISYLQVLLFATIPTSVLPGHHPGHRDGQPPLRHPRGRRRHQAAGLAAARYGYYFSSLILIVVFMAVGLSPFRRCCTPPWSPSPSASCRETRWTPRRVFDCLAAGTLGVLPVVAVCAAAGIIVAVVSLTGLGLKASSLIVGAAGGTLVLAASTRPSPSSCWGWPCR